MALSRRFFPDLPTIFSARADELFTTASTNCVNEFSEKRFTCKIQVKRAPTIRRHNSSVDLTFRRLVSAALSCVIVVRTLRTVVRSGREPSPTEARLPTQHETASMLLSGSRRPHDAARATARAPKNAPARNTKISSAKYSEFRRQMPQKFVGMMARSSSARPQKNRRQSY